MGYALFANRKLALCAEINTLQMQLDQIMAQKESMLNYSANVSSGMFSIEDVALDFTNANNYAAYTNELESYITNQTTFVANGVSASSLDELALQLGEYYDQNNQNSALADAEKQAARAAYIANGVNAARQSLSREFYNNSFSKTIAAKEYELERKQKRIETQLTALQSTLQSVEQAEGQAIQNATPKFAGVG